MKQQRERGRYSHTLEKVCTCGHALGQHIAEGPLSQRECVHAGCTCEGFKVKKSKVAQKRLWRVTEGTSTAKVRADTYADAKTRAAQIGFRDPDSIVLIEEAKKNPAKRSTAHLRKYQFKKGHGAKKRASKKKAARKSALVRTQYVVAAQGKGKKMLFDGGKRFTENAPPKMFATQAAALEAARGLLKRFPKLGRYRVTVESF